MMIVQLILAVGGIIRGDFGLFYYVPRNLGLLYPVTEVIGTYVFKALTTNGDFGMSAAVGLFQSVVGCLMILLTNKLGRFEPGPVLRRKSMKKRTKSLAGA